MNFLAKNKKVNKKFGFSLLELVLAIALFSLGSVAMATLLIDSNISTKLGMERTEALIYAKESLGAVREIRAGVNGWDNLTIGNHGLVNVGGWSFSSSSDLINNKYTRVVNIANGVTSTSTKDISINIFWNLNAGRVSSVLLNTVLTNWSATTSTSTSGL